MSLGYRVWWIPQVPMPAFKVEVPTLPEARRLCDTLAAYDAFQYEHQVKPDYCNAGGVEQLLDGEWVSLDDEDDQS